MESYNSMYWRDVCDGPLSAHLDRRGDAAPIHVPRWSDFLQESRDAPAPMWIGRLRLDDLAPPRVQTLRPLTTLEEQARAREYRFDADQQRHLAGRGLIRLLLAYRYGGAPREASITEGPNGKPQVHGCLDDQFSPEFNIAHASDIVVAALGEEEPLGIDIEPLTREANPEALAGRVLTPTERERCRALPDEDRSPFLLHVWTCKEAFLKATGTGLRRDPTTIECTFDGPTVTGIDDADTFTPATSTGSAARWTVKPFLAADDIVGAVVYPRDGSLSPTFCDAGRLVTALSGGISSLSGRPAHRS